MAADIIPVRSEIDAVWCVTADGISLALPLPYVQQCLAQGSDRVIIGEVLLRPNEPTRPWLTVTEAAQLLRRDLRPAIDAADDARLLSEAKAAVSRTCNRGQIRHEGARGQRRLDPESFDAWCLARRRRADLT